MNKNRLVFLSKTILFLVITSTGTVAAPKWNCRTETGMECANQNLPKTGNRLINRRLESNKHLEVIKVKRMPSYVPAPKASETKPKISVPPRRNIRDHRNDVPKANVSDRRITVRPKKYIGETEKNLHE